MSFKLCQLVAEDTGGGVDHVMKLTFNGEMCDTVSFVLTPGCASTDDLWVVNGTCRWVGPVFRVLVVCFCWVSESCNGVVRSVRSVLCLATPPLAALSNLLCLVIFLGSGRFRVVIVLSFRAFWAGCFSFGPVGWFLNLRQLSVN